MTDLWIRPCSGAIDLVVSFSYAFAAKQLSQNLTLTQAFDIVTYCYWRGKCHPSRIILPHTCSWYSAVAPPLTLCDGVFRQAVQERSQSVEANHRSHFKRTTADDRTGNRSRRAKTESAFVNRFVHVFIIVCSYLWPEKALLHTFRFNLSLNSVVFVADDPRLNALQDKLQQVVDTSFDDVTNERVRLELSQLDPQFQAKGWCSGN